MNTTLTFPIFSFLYFPACTFSCCLQSALPFPALSFSVDFSVLHFQSTHHSKLRCCRSPSAMLFPGASPVVVVLMRRWRQSTDAAGDSCINARSTEYNLTTSQMNNATKLSSSCVRPSVCLSLLLATIEISVTRPNNCDGWCDER